MHQSTIDAYTKDFHQWVEQYLCQRWLPGLYQASRQLFSESLVQAPAYHRTMVAARQIYTLSKLLELFPEHAHSAQWRVQLQQQAWHLHHTFFLEPEKKWVFSVDAEGNPYQTDQELYSYAFIVFAMSELLKSHPQWFHADRLETALDNIKHFFDPQTQGWCSRKTIHGAVLEGSTQNPLMHLFEAFCALHAVDSDVLPLARIEHLWQYVHTTFYVPSISAIAELPTQLPVFATQPYRYFDRAQLVSSSSESSDGNRLESGHQFEWAYLLSQSPLMSRITLENLREGVLYHSDKIADYPLVPLSMELDYLTPIQDQSRIWVQCEWTRTLSILRQYFPTDERLSFTLARALQTLTQRFLHTEGWYEVLDYAGQPLRSDQPASTAYHLIGCLAALKSVSP